ncbi:helix-turn-helix domain-containing protein [Kutzneria sp. NPDC051319]|uniref:helix-turn-helix transcriptional regulator n=1 Tax=Kutzneria sp. NPDC051319 TaxID=3155047 RepID=UPI003424CFB3
MTDSVDESDGLMTVRQFCATVGVSRDTFYRWRQLGSAPASYRLPNGSLRISMSDYRTWLTTIRDGAA